MHKTRAGNEKQEELVAVMATLEPEATQSALLTRAKYAALAILPAA